VAGRSGSGPHHRGNRPMNRDRGSTPAIEVDREADRVQCWLVRNPLATGAETDQVLRIVFRDAIHPAESVVVGKIDGQPLVTLADLGSGR